ncbi:MAG: hypothetical protein H6954_06440 [Chromatiaceae bacterium]|nr:hypothetical protein [Chromatiaceae bacterium]
MRKLALLWVFVGMLGSSALPAATVSVSAGPRSSADVVTLIYAIDGIPDGDLLEALVLGGDISFDTSRLEYTGDVRKIGLLDATEGSATRRAFFVDGGVGGPPAGPLTVDLTAGYGLGFAVPADGGDLFEIDFRLKDGAVAGDARVDFHITTLGLDESADQMVTALVQVGVVPLPSMAIPFVASMIGLLGFRRRCARVIRRSQ